MRLYPACLILLSFALADRSNAFPLNPIPDGTIVEAQCPPDALVAVLYKQVEFKSPLFSEDGSRALLDGFFAKPLAELIWKDGQESAKTGDAGVLDFDPFYQAQDVDGVKNFVIGDAEIDGEKATVVVSFENLGQKMTLKYQLVQESGNWRIADIDYSEMPDYEGVTLLGMLEETYQ